MRVLLAELISLTQYSMSHDDTRARILPERFSKGDGKVVRMVTTDGHRLSKAEHKAGGKGAMMNFSMLVPHKGISRAEAASRRYEGLERARATKARPDRHR